MKGKAFLRVHESGYEEHVKDPLINVLKSFWRVVVVLGPLSLFWSILTAHVEGVVTRVYKLAPVTYVNLPWTNILPMGIEEEGGGGGAACYRNRIKLNPFKPRGICVALVRLYLLSSL